MIIAAPSSLDAHPLESRRSSSRVQIQFPHLGISPLSEMSVELLVRFSVSCKASSYGEVVERVLGRTSRVLSKICIVVNNAEILVVYMIIIGDVMSGSGGHVGVFDQIMGNGAWDHRKLVMLAVMLVFLVLLCALERVDSLCLTFAASVVLAVVFVVVSCSIAFIKLVEGQVEMPRMLLDFVSRKAILDFLVQKTCDIQLPIHSSDASLKL